MKFHPAAELFPLMSESDLRRLSEDIKANGLNEPIVMHEGSILDGRNRFKACELAGVRPVFRDWEGTPGSPVVWVISQNLHRRHLTDSQKAAIAVEVEAMLAKEIKRGRPNKESKIRHISMRADIAAGKALGVSRAYVSTAKRLSKESPDLFDEVKKGSKGLNQAINEVRHNAPPIKPVTLPGFPTGPFRAIVIDPPWPIEKIMFGRRPVEKASLDYTVMEMAEIAALPIPKLADERGCHVYLWVTHRHLPAGLQLFLEWGVRYECLLTWNKPTAQPLWWRFLTEHCLFGKIGSLPPLQKGCAVSFSAPQQKHSHKPDEFFDLVRTVSRGPRLTMFDCERKDFERWGVVH